MSEPMTEADVQLWRDYLAWYRGLCNERVVEVTPTDVRRFIATIDALTAELTRYREALGEANDE